MADIWMDVDTALSEVPVNLFPLIDDTDFKSREMAITYNQAGMDLVWNFVTTAGAMTQTAVTPTTGGNYDWTNQGDGMYTIEIPASGGASINNNTEGFGWFTGICTGVLPWRSPIIGFRASGLNDKLIDNAYSATQGLAGTDLDANIAGVETKIDTIDGIVDAILADTGTDGVAIANGAITAAKIADGAIDNTALASDLDTYQAKVIFIDDDNGTNDRYIVIFYKNGEPITSGITSPTIQVIKCSDGTDLISSTALTQIGSLGLYKRDEATNRIADGDSYIVKTQATIGGATRTWFQPVGRDD